LSQRSVEQVIGKLVTDEAFRQRFTRDPDTVLAELTGAGWDLNPCEQRALAAFDARVAERCARDVDPRLLKADLLGRLPRRPAGGASPSER
jgi:hypothetical protein